MLKVGLFGTGNVISRHKETIENIPGLKFAGHFDTSRITFLSQQNFPVNDKEFIELFEKSDIIDIVSQDIPVFNFVSHAIKAVKHVFLEYSLPPDIHEIENLLNLQQEAHTKLQMGYNERFNPAFRAALPHFHEPMFIESHRLIPFNSVQPQFSIIPHTMIHDIDIILWVVKANIKKVHTSGVKVFGNAPDIVNAHLEFDNGATANLTLNRISSKNIHYSKFYQPHSRVQVDFLKQSAKVLKQEKGKFKVNKLEIFPENKIETAFKEFIKSIEKNSEPIVSLEDYHRVLQIAAIITDKIQIINKAV